MHIKLTFLVILIRNVAFNSGSVNNTSAAAVESVDESWKKLSQGPKMKHTTPVRSTGHSLNLPKRVAVSMTN